MSDTAEWTDADEKAFNSQLESDPPSEPAPEPTPEPAPEPSSEPAPTEAPAGDDDDDDEAPTAAKPDSVPYWKLQRTRERLKKREEQFAALEKRTNLLLERFATPEQRSEPQPQAPQAPPRAEDDIFGATDYNTRSIEEIRAALSEQRQRDNEQSVVQRILTAAADHERTFTEKQPDYLDALRHLRENRLDELMLLGGLERSQAAGMLQREEIQLAQAALQSGRSPAELVYTLAKKRGYARKQEIAAAGEAQSENAAERIERTAELQAKSRTLSGGGSVPKPGGIDAKALLRMSEEDFDKFAKTNPDQMKKLLML